MYTVHTRISFHSNEQNFHSEENFNVFNSDGFTQYFVKCIHSDRNEFCVIFLYIQLFSDDNQFLITQSNIVCMDSKPHLLSLKNNKFIIFSDDMLPL